MADLEVPLARVEDLALEARQGIEQTLARMGGDRAAFWHAVALIYRRDFPEPVHAQAEMSIAA